MTPFPRQLSFGQLVKRMIKRLQPLSPFNVEVRHAQFLVQPLQPGVKHFVLLLLPALGRRVAEVNPAAEWADGVGRAEAADLVPAALAIGGVVRRPLQIESGQFQRRHEQQMPVLFELAALTRHVAPRPADVNRPLHVGVDRRHPFGQRRHGSGAGDGVAEDDLLVGSQAQASDSTILAKALPAPTMPRETGLKQ